MSKFAKKDMSPFTRRVYEQGKADGAHETAVSGAEALIKFGLPLEAIANCLGLPLEEVEAIAKGLSKKEA